MLQKPSDIDAIEQVRSDPRVQCAIDFYHQMSRANRAALHIYFPEDGEFAGMRTAIDVPIDRGAFKGCLLDNAMLKEIAAKKW
jgi:hypothetical protein